MYESSWPNSYNGNISDKIVEKLKNAFYVQQHFPLKILPFLR